MHVLQGKMIAAAGEGSMSSSSPSVVAAAWSIGVIEGVGYEFVTVDGEREEEAEDRPKIGSM